METSWSEIGFGMEGALDMAVTEREFREFVDSVNRRLGEIDDELEYISKELVNQDVRTAQAEAKAFKAEHSSNTVKMDMDDGLDDLRTEMYSIIPDPHYGPSGDESSSDDWTSLRGYNQPREAAARGHVRMKSDDYSNVRLESSHGLLGPVQAGAANVGDSEGDDVFEIGVYYV